MISHPRKEFFNWLSTGIAATSLALVILIPSIAIANETAKWISFGLFLAAMPFAVAASAILKEVDVWAVEVSKTAKGAHAAAIFFAICLYLFGFGVFIFSLGKCLFLVFLASVALSYYLYMRAQNDLSKP